VEEPWQSAQSGVVRLANQECAAHHDGIDGRSTGSQAGAVGTHRQFEPGHSASVTGAARAQQVRVTPREDDKVARGEPVDAELSHR